MKTNRRRVIFANKLHRDIFILVLLASIVPALIAAFCLHYLIFNITAQQIGIPEGIAYTLIPVARIVARIISIATPISIILILMFAYFISHKIVGPFDRIVRELEQCIDGDKKDHIILRKNDKFQPLVKRINKLLDKLLT